MAARAALLLVLAYAAAAAAAPITVFANTCTDVQDGFDALQTAWDGATKATPLSLAVTLNCTPSFALWQPCIGGIFTAIPPLGNIPKPPVSISIACKGSGTLTVAQNAPGGNFLNINTQAAAIRTTVSLSGFQIAAQSAISFTAAAGSRSTLKLTNMVVDNAATSVLATGVDSVAISGGQISDNTVAGVVVSNSKSVSISNVRFADWTHAVQLDLPAGAKVAVKNNTFKSATTADDTAILAVLAGDRVAIDLSKTVTDNSLTTPICITGAATKATVKVTGSSGFGPLVANKTLGTPSGYPVANNCTIAAFTAT